MIDVGVAGLTDLDVGVAGLTDFRGEMKLLVFNVLFIAITRATIVAPNPTVVLPDAVDRANQTLQGLFSYFWKVDPLAKRIGFFFACGQIGGFGTPYKWNECSCYNKASCANCYRWWDAVALESTANYGIHTKTKEHSTAAQIVFAHSPYNSNWNARTTQFCTYIDDFVWYGIAYLKVYEWLKEPIWLNRSVSLYDWAWKNGWDYPCGGFWWNACGNLKFKNSITILEMLHFSSKLAYMFPNNASYLHDAQRIWNWVFSFDDGYGLMSDKYLVSTGAIPELCCNASASKIPYKQCHNSKQSGTSYNQGMLMSSAAYLYRTTKDTKYLKVGMRALEAIFENYTTPDGVLVDEPRSYPTFMGGQCWGGSGDPGGDWYSFSGIFMLHLGYFTELMAETDALSHESLTKIYNLVLRTSDSAWLKSAVWPPFKASDICNPSPELNVTYPKFNWWWSKNVTQQVIPSDPKLIYHKNQLRCVTINGNDTQLWEGMAGSEDACANECMSNNTCSKYLYQTDQATVPGIDCWIWSYNRSNHICNQSDYNFNVGVKRPFGNATCAGRCGSKQAQNLTHGVCYCDADCTKHLDCCMDFADQCVKEDYISCKGKCNQVQPQAIPGGGYCWCSNGCYGWFTDNNSQGSCCPDYNTVCEGVVLPEMCLDARSQGSAVNLFLGHLKVSQVAIKAGIFL